MRTKYTKGPWLVTRERDGLMIRYDNASSTPNGYLIALILEDQQPNQCKANAQLIAAAPDLLEAAKAALNIRLCGCYTIDEPEWHSDKCYKPILIKAIALAEKEE